MENANGIRLVLLDIDGTLIDSPRSWTLAEETPEIFWAVMDKGVMVGFASGRNFAKIDYHMGAIGVNGPLICNNGAVIRDNKTIFVNRVLPEKTVRAIFDFSRRMGCCMELSTDSCVYLHKFEGYNGPLFPDLDNRNYLRTVPDTAEAINQICKEPINKATLISGSPEQAEAVWEGWKEAGRLLDKTEQTRSFWFASEITPVGVSKGSGMILASEIWNIPLENIMAVGDGDNDTGMLRSAGLSFAMENGSEAAKRAARYIAPPVTRNGALEVLKRYILEEQDLPPLRIP